MIPGSCDRETLLDVIRRPGLENIGLSSNPRDAMSEEKPNKNYPDTTELYRRMDAHRKAEARRPLSEKMAAVVRLREFERSLENIRQANRAKRAAKQITIKIKTR